MNRLYPIFVITIIPFRVFTKKTYNINAIYRLTILYNNTELSNCKKYVLRNYAINHKTLHKHSTNHWYKYKKYKQWIKILPGIGVVWEGNIYYMTMAPVIPCYRRRGEGDWDLLQGWWVEDCDKIVNIGEALWWSN